MAQGGFDSPRAVSLDELAALNDEIAALVRAGVPLERSLLGIGHDVPGRLGRITRHVAERLDRGESLAAAVASEEFPPVYRAIVEAGCAAGRLPAALQGLATSARRMGELRRVVLTAMLYPIVVLLVVYFLFVLLTTRVAPAFPEAFESTPATTPAVIEMLVRLGQIVEGRVWVAPVVLLSAVALWWLAAGRANVLDPRSVRWLYFWCPWVGRIVRHAELATLADLLGLMIAAGVPLPEALKLAAATCHSAHLRQAAGSLAARLQRGESLTDGGLETDGLPPLVRLMMITGQQRSALPESLAHAAENYHQRAMHEAEMLQTLLPAALTVCVGGVVTLIYAVAYFVPMTMLLDRLAG